MLTNGAALSVAISLLDASYLGIAQLEFFHSRVTLWRSWLWMFLPKIVTTLSSQPFIKRQSKCFYFLLPK